ncbi:MAG: type II toxin-antitoxin system VapC family toxin [Deltaproteobacteria bacterium]|nr:type II toxin-antitoxin system VapC family toxin [Deltaproteobacteria bacterium]
MIVLDASVALKWIFGEEEGGEKAGLYKEGHVTGKEPIAVHSLFFYEIANVLATKTRLSSKDAAEAFSLIWTFDLEVFGLGLDEYLEGIALSRQYGITLYDAVYVVLAKKLGCPFVTSDRNLYKKLKDLKELRIV